MIACNGTNIVKSGEGRHFMHVLLLTLDTLFSFQFLAFSFLDLVSKFHTMLCHVAASFSARLATIALLFFITFAQLDIFFQSP